MERLVNAIESIYAILGGSNIDEDEQKVDLLNSVELLVNSLDSLDISFIANDSNSAEVITQGIRVLATILIAGREEQSNMQNLCTMIWKCYGKIIKKYSSYVDEESSKQFLTAIIEHTKDGVLHISSECIDLQSDVSSYHKVLTFFAQRLAQSLVWIPASYVEEERIDGFHVLVSVVGLNWLLLKTNRLPHSLSSGQQVLLKNIMKLVSIDEIMNSHVENHYLDQLWAFHKASMAKNSITSELRLEVHCGYFFVLLSIFDHWKENSLLLEGKSQLGYAALQILSRILLHLTMFVTATSNAQEILTEFNRCASFLALYLIHSPSESQYLLDWLTSLSFGYSLDSAANLNITVFPDTLDDLALVSRKMLVSTLQQLPIELDKISRDAAIGKDDSWINSWENWKSQWVRRQLNVLIVAFHQEMCDCQYSMSASKLDPYPNVDRIIDMINDLLVSSIPQISDSILRHIAESFLFHTGIKAISSSKLQIIPLNVLETVFSRWTVSRLHLVAPDAVNIIRSMLRRTVLLLRASMPSDSANSAVKPLHPSVEALCLTFLQTIVNGGINLAENGVVFEDEGDLRKLSTRIMQIIRTLTAQMQLYSLQPDSILATSYKVRDWVRHITTLLSLFHLHKNLPKAVRQLLAECMTRIVTCWKVLVQLHSNISDDSCSSARIRQILSAIATCVLTMLKLLAIQPVASIPVNTQNELTYGLKLFGEAMQSSDASLSSLYCEFGEGLLELVETHGNSMWLAMLLESEEGNVWRHLLQLSVQQAEKKRDRQINISFLKTWEGDSLDSRNSNSAVEGWPVLAPSTESTVEGNGGFVTEEVLTGLLSGEAESEKTQLKSSPNNLIIARQFTNFLAANPKKQNDNREYVISTAKNETSSIGKKRGIEQGSECNSGSVSTDASDNSQRSSIDTSHNSKSSEPNKTKKLRFAEDIESGKDCSEESIMLVSAEDSVGVEAEAELVASIVSSAEDSVVEPNESTQMSQDDERAINTLTPTSLTQIDPPLCDTDHFDSGYETEE